MDHRPKHILIAGAATSAWLNVGDEAILSSMVADLRAAIPHAHISIVSSNPKGSLAAYHVNEVPAQDIGQIIKTAQASDLIVLGGGGIFYDYWGFYTQDLLTSHHSGHGIFIDLGLLATLLNKPLMIYAVGVGPLFSQTGKYFTKITAEQANAITVRDVESKHTLVELGLNYEKIHVTADPVFSDQENFLTAATRQVKAEQQDDQPTPVIGVVLRSWEMGQRDCQEWESAIAQALDQFIDQYDGSIRFIPFFKEKHDVHDLQTAKSVCLKMKHSDRVTFIKEDASPAERLKALIESDIILGMRLHAIIFAITHVIPAVALAYDPKVTNLMNAIQKPDLCIELDQANPKVIFNCLATAYEEQHALRSDFTHYKGVFSKLAQENAEIARTLINQDRTEKPSLSHDTIETIKAILVAHALRSHQLTETNLNKQQEIEKWVDYTKLLQEDFQAQEKTLFAQIQDLSAQNQYLLNNQKLLQENLQRHQGMIHSLNAQILLMKTSFSWKITRPMRLFARLIRNRGISAQDRNTIAFRLDDYFEHRSAPSWLKKYLINRFPLPTPETKTITFATPIIQTAEFPLGQTSADLTQVIYQKNKLPFTGVRAPHGQRRVGMLTNMLLDWRDGRPRFGGGERYALELATLMQHLGLSPTFFQPSTQGHGEGKYYNFPVITFPIGEHFAEFNFSGCTYFTEQTKDYDHVYYHLPEYASGEIREDGLMTCHGIWFDHRHNSPAVRSPQWFNHLYHAFANPQAVISVDTHSISVIRSLWPEIAKHLYYIPNFFDGAVNYPDSSKRNSNKLTIIFPRRSYILRGSRIFPEIVDNIPHDVDIYWIGEGDPEDTQIIKDVCERDSRVNFVSADFGEMPAWYQKADIAVIPTLGSEGTSLSCLEALASGCATIATNIGGLNDLILNQYNGYVVEPKAYEITQAINFLIENKEERLRLEELAPQSVQFFERHYWQDKWSRLLLNLGWINEAAYEGWKSDKRSIDSVKHYPAFQLPKEKWVILTRNAIHGGVESLIDQEARILDAPVIVCGGHEQPETCPFAYTRADDPKTLNEALHPYDIILYHWLPDWAVQEVAESGKPSLEFVHRMDTSESDKQVPTGLVTHSKFLAEFIHQEYGRLSHVVNHPIDTTRFSPPLEKGQYIGAVTSYYETKGIDLFIRAWAQLKDEFPHIPVRFYGSGEDQAKFEQLAKDLGVKAEFCPPTTKVWEALADYRLFIVPSRIEGFPVTILEALAMNVPVIASDLEGIEEFNSTAVFNGYSPFITTFERENVEDLIAVLRATLLREGFAEPHEYINKYYNPQAHCDGIVTALRKFQSKIHT